MFIHTFAVKCLKGVPVEVKLPRPGLKLDPRAIGPRANDSRELKFHIRYHDDDITATLTRIDDYRINVNSFQMRVYDPTTETVPKFNTTVYTYLGQDGERAPHDTTHVHIDPSVKTIKEKAFILCDEMVRCSIHHGVERIEQEAFWCCTSLEALFIPTSVKTIGNGAFYFCAKMKILSLPPINVDIKQIRRGLMRTSKCIIFFDTTHIQHCRLDNSFAEIYDDGQVNRAVLDFCCNHHIPPLHQICLSTNVSAQTITDCIIKHGVGATHIKDHNNMTPLHYLAMNPHADSDAITSCLHANMNAVFLRDRWLKTPLCYLREYGYAEGIMSITCELCLHRATLLKAVHDR